MSNFCNSIGKTGAEQGKFRNGFFIALPMIAIAID
jgi:hypothetical protein